MSFIFFETELAEQEKYRFIAASQDIANEVVGDFFQVSQRKGTRHWMTGCCTRV
jgi:hypothetical protein